MRHYCTYFDRHYLTRGLALYHSLAACCVQPFTLWVLCFDKETFDVLSRLRLPNLELITQEEFERGDDLLVLAKQGRSRVEYYWTCTPSLPLYVLQIRPDIELITYLDADLFFYSDPEPVFDELGSKSILIIEHRYPPEYAAWAQTSGIYNVQFMTFRRDENGIAALRWWRERCIEWCYDRREGGKCGDQKYLDDWPERFSGVVVLQHKGAGVAPWNMKRYDIRRQGGNLMVDGEILIFHHFHSLKLIHAWICVPNTTYHYRARDLVFVYDPYLRMLRYAGREVFLQTGRANLPARLSLQGLYQGFSSQGWLLTRMGVFSRCLWNWGVRYRKTEELVDRGYEKFKLGDRAEARRSMFAAMRKNLLILGRPGVLAILVKTIIVNRRLDSDEKGTAQR